MLRKYLAMLFTALLLVVGATACSADVDVPEGEGEGVGVEVEGGEEGD